MTSGHTNQAKSDFNGLTCVPKQIMATASSLQFAEIKLIEEGRDKKKKGKLS